MTDPRTLWQGQADTVQALSPADIRKASSKLAKRAKWRAWRVYLAAMVWMPFFVVQIYHNTEPLVRWGQVLVILGGFFAIWEQARYLRERAAAEAKDFLETYRLHLAKECDMLRWIQRRHLLPFVPGIVLITAGVAQLNAPANWFVVNLGGIILLFAWSRWFAGRALRRVQDELDAIGAGTTIAEPDHRQGNR